MEALASAMALRRRLRRLSFLVRLVRLGAVEALLVSGPSLLLSPLLLLE